MADKGIIFSAAMVRALLGGRKSQTRRLLSPQPRKWEARVIDIAEPIFDEKYRQWGQWETIWNRCSAMWEPEEDVFHPLKLAYAPGDRLYVREAFSYADNRAETVWYWADGNIAAFDCGKPKPSIHMPRWASRLWLAVTDVRVQRVAEISEEDAVAEGIQAFHPGRPPSVVTFFHHTIPEHRNAGFIDARRAFEDLWNSLHTKPGERWEDSPWVVAVSFTVHHGNIDQIHNEGAGAANNRSGDIQR